MFGNYLTGEEQRAAWWRMRASPCRADALWVVSGLAELESKSISSSSSRLFNAAQTLLWTRMSTLLKIETQTLLQYDIWDILKKNCLRFSWLLPNSKCWCTHLEDVLGVLPTELVADLQDFLAGVAPSLHSCSTKAVSAFRAARRNPSAHCEQQA